MNLQNWLKRMIVTSPDLAALRSSTEVPVDNVPRQQMSVIVGIFTLATLGLYSFYWFARSWREISLEREDADRTHPWIHSFLIVFPLSAGAILMMNWPPAWWHLIGLPPLVLGLLQLYKHFRAMATVIEAGSHGERIYPMGLTIATGATFVIGSPLLDALIDWSEVIDPGAVTSANFILSSYLILLVPVTLAALTTYGQWSLNSFLRYRYGGLSASKTGIFTIISTVFASLFVAFLALMITVGIAQWSGLSNRAETALEWLFFGYQYPTTGIVLDEADVWAVDMDGDRIVQYDRATGEAIGEISVGDKPYGLAIVDRDLWVTNRTEETIYRIDLETREIVDRIKLRNRPTTLVYGEGSLWIVLSNGSEVLRFDPETKEIVAEIEVGLDPAGLAIDNGYVWVTTTGSHRLKKIDTGTNEVVADVAAECMPIDVTVGHGSVWVARAGGCNILRLDPDTLEEEATIPGRHAPWVLISADEGIWVAHQAKAVSLIDVEMNRVVAFAPFEQYLTGMVEDGGDLWLQHIDEGRVERVAKSTIPENGTSVAVATWTGDILVTGDDVWVTSIFDGTVWRLDREFQRPATIINVGVEPSALGLSESSLWVANTEDGTVSRIDTDLNRVVTTIDVGGNPAGMVVVDGEVWVTNYLGDEVSVIDIATETVVATYSVGVSPVGITFGFDSIWVANYDSGTVTRIDPGSQEALAETLDVGENPRSVIASEDSIWVASDGGDLLTRIDPATNETIVEIPIEVPADVEDIGTEPLQMEPTSLAIADDMILVSNTGSVVAVVDPTSNEVVGMVNVSGMTFSIYFDRDELWVSNFENATVSRFGPELIDLR